MSGLMSKRQQARNEKVLQDLVQSVPGNNFCADCQARNPAWASWNLGIFLCMRCAAIHRKLGTHISKVKSLSMDSWTNEQVESMKRVGNVASNKIYNAQNKKPPVPIDADEADSAMERFIRAKYVQPATNGTKKHKTGSSDEGTPPPLPPKTGSRFFSFRSKKDTHSRDSVFGVHEPQRGADQRRDKPSKVFGASVHQDTPEDTAQKLIQLRDMGFTDDKRNAMILKGVNGNLEKTIEALVRLGEGGGASLSIPSRDNSLPTSRSLTPQPLTPQPTSPRPTIGLSKSSPSAAPSPASPASNNPWDIQPAQPQSSQSTGTLQNRNPFYAANPFGMPSQQAEFNLNQSLQNLAIAPSQQALFPNHTGGMPASQPISPISQPFYQQSMTPPIPQTQGFRSVSFNSNQTYPQPTLQQPQGYNPFLQAPANPQPALSVNTSPFQNQGSLATNPFARSPTRIASPTLNQIPEQTQQNFYNSPHSPYASNPFLTTSQQVQSPSPASLTQPTQQAWYEPQPFAQTAAQPAYQPVYQQPQRADTASIMALYNYPQLAPARSPTQDQNASSMQTNQAAPTPTQPQAPPQQVPSSPLSGNKNPFMHSAATPATATAAAPSPFASHSNPNPVSSSARSRDSMTLGMEMAWNNGRHSPDAFASLSARSS
ncbi:ArfGap-domain-containing protein [Hypomontagnella submonticulosa]|nr:ArfGap-domain-containing protein [Hypomontagnella submonticulosa]